MPERVVKTKAFMVSRALRKAGHRRAVVTSTGTVREGGFQARQGWEDEVFVLDRRWIDGKWQSFAPALEHYAETLASAGYRCELSNPTGPAKLNVWKKETE